MKNIVNYVIESDVVISGATNFEIINKDHPILCGAGLYVSGGVSYYNMWSDLIVCIGNEYDEINKKEILNTYKNKLRDKKVQVHIFENYGKNFKHFIDTSSGVEKKDYGNYINFVVESLTIRAKYLILGTGTPKYQKSILRSCKTSELIAWDSKEIYYKTQIEELIKILPLVNMYSATSNEINILLKHLKLSSPCDLFGLFKNLKYILFKEGAKGGSLYICDGICHDYEVMQNFKAINTSGAGDILLGGLVGGMNFWGRENIALSLKVAAELATKSVLANGMNKIDFDYQGDIVNITSRRWKSS